MLVLGGTVHPSLILRPPSQEPEARATGATAGRPAPTYQRSSRASGKLIAEQLVLSLGRGGAISGQDKPARSVRWKTDGERGRESVHGPGRRGVCAAFAVWTADAVAQALGRRAGGSPRGLGGGSLASSTSGRSRRFLSKHHPDTVRAKAFWCEICRYGTLELAAPFSFRAEEIPP